MLVDTSLVVADNIEVPTAIGVGKIGDDVELSKSRVGDGKTLFFCMDVTTSFAGTTKTRINFFIRTSSTVSGLFNIINCTNDFRFGNLPVLGSQIVLPFPPGVIYKKYVFLGIQIFTAVLTAGAVTAYITYNQPANWYPGKEAPD